MRAVLRPVLVVVGATALLVPSGAGPAAAAVIEERRDTWHPENATCQVVSRQSEESDGTISLSTIPTTHPDEPSNDTACYWGAVEAVVRYTYRDADGDLQSGEAAAPRGVSVSLPSAGVTELRTWHQVTYYDGTTTPEYTLPK